MTKVEFMKAREVIKRLEADGWYRIRSKSGHRQFKHSIKKGRSIWKQAQLPEEA